MEQNHTNIGVTFALCDALIAATVLEINLEKAVHHGDTENNLKIILTGYTGIAVNGGVTFWVKTKNQIFSVFSSVSPCLRGSIAVFRINHEM